jgi:hypothetical protein
LKNFFSQPTMTGFADLMSTTSATGEALGGLGAAAGAAIPIIGAVIAVVAIGVVVFKALQAAAEKMRQIIEKLTRYSGELMKAAATEKLREFQRQLEEARENGALYARAQNEATRANDASADVSREWNKVVAVGAIIFHRLTTVVMKLIYPFAYAAGKIAELWNWMDKKGDAIMGGLQSGVRWVVENGMKPFGNWLDKTMKNSGDPILKWLGSFGLFGKLSGWIEKALIWLGVIADNTKKPTTSGINDWFRADVLAMTGRKY